MRTTIDAVTPSTPPFNPSGQGTPQSKPRRRMALRNEVPEEDMDWDIGGPKSNPMEDLGIGPQQRLASRSRGQRKEKEYMEGVRGGVPGRAYVEEPQRTCLDLEEEMDIAAVGSHGRRPVGTSVDLRAGDHGLGGS